MSHGFQGEKKRGGAKNVKLTVLSWHRNPSPEKDTKAPDSENKAWGRRRARGGKVWRVVERQTVAALRVCLCVFLCGAHIEGPHLCVCVCV